MLCIVHYSLLVFFFLFYPWRCQFFFPLTNLNVPLISFASLLFLILQYLGYINGLYNFEIRVTIYFFGKKISVYIKYTHK